MRAKRASIVSQRTRPFGFAQGRLLAQLAQILAKQSALAQDDNLHNDHPRHHVIFQ